MSEDEHSEFFRKFSEQLQTTDPFIQAVLNAHLDVEAHLEEFLEEIFFHPEDVEEANLRFRQKIYMARAYVELGKERPEWRVMLELNAIRNKIAHRSNREGMTIELQKLRDILSGFGTEKFREEIRGCSPTVLIVNAALVASGYLICTTDELKKLQGKEVDDDK